MVLVDKKILSGGLAMLIVGIAIIAYLNSNVPIGYSGMTLVPSGTGSFVRSAHHFPTSRIFWRFSDS